MTSLIWEPTAMKPAIWAIFVLSMGTGLVSAQPPEFKEWTPRQMMQVKRISGVQVAPDGKRVVYAVREAVLDAGRSEYRTHIYLTHADGSNTVPLTSGEKSCDDPQWSPDGQSIAFLSAKTGRRNLWLIEPTGKHAIQLTDAKTNITSFKWLPDSKRIAFTAMDGLTPVEEKAKQEKNDARVVDENIKMSRLHVVNAEPARTGKRDVENWSGSFAGSITGSGRGGYDWSPDGKRLVLSTTRTPSPDDWTTARLLVTNEPGLVTAVTLLKETRAAAFSPLWSPDGQAIAYIASDTPPTWAGAGRVHVVSFGGVRKPTVLADTHDGWGRYSELIGWSRDGRSLYFTEIHGTVTHLGCLPLNGSPEIIAKMDGIASNIHLNATRTHIGFTLEALDKAPEAYISPIDRFEPRAVSKVNANLPALPLGPTEVIRWKSKDGLEIEGLLTYPVGYARGKRYPLLLNVHGGPMGAFTQTHVASPGLYPIAAFSVRGYAVLRPNPRGSSGYGKKFRHANYGDWGGGDYQDVMTGVDHIIRMGIADEKRLGVMGWSYGGFMTSWIVTQTHRFQAASVGAGVTNLMSFTGTADIPSFLPDYFNGEPWDNFEAYRKHSAMFHVKGVKTPTLIQHGERDERVPLSQGLEFYNALKRQGCTTKMVIYPRTPHGIEEPRLLVDCMERNLEWFDRHVGKK